MKTLSVAVLFLLLAFGGLGALEFVQYRQIAILETQVSVLRTEVQTQIKVSSSQKKAIVQIQTRDKTVNKVLHQIVDFLNSVDVEPAPADSAKPGANS